MMILTWLQQLASQPSKKASRTAGRSRTARRMGLRLVLERLEDRLAPAKATPAFSALTASQTISYGTPSVLLGGLLNAGLLNAPVGQSVSISFGNSGYTATATTGIFGIFQTTVPTSALNAGAYTITYSYAGDANFNAASDSSTTLTITKLQPTFSGLTPSQIVSYGTSVFLSGVLNAGPSQPVPAGESVYISVGNGNPVTATTGSGGSFQVNVPAIATAGFAYAITYSYLGDTNFNATSDSSTTLGITQAQPAFSGLTAAPTVTYGTASVSLSGVLSAGSSVPVPAGDTVVIDLDNNHSVTATIGGVGSFQADLPTGDLAVAAYPIHYTFLGDTNFLGTSDTSTKLKVTKGQSTFTNLAQSQSVPYSTPSVIVSGVLNAPVGETVTIDLGSSEPIVSAVTVAGGLFQAILPTATLPVAVYTVRYTYAGNSNFNGTSDTSTTLTVTKFQPAFSGLAASQAITYGTDHVIVSGVLDVPAGETVTIDIGSAYPAVTATTVIGGGFHAVLPTSTVAVAVYTIRYSYPGDSNDLSTSDISTILTVNKAQSAFSGLIATPPSPYITYGDPSVFLYGVLNAGALVPVPPGEPVTIDLKDSTDTVTTATTGNGGYFQANLPTSDLVVATYGIRYTYRGNSNFIGAIDTTTTLTVNKAQPMFSGLNATPTITYGDASVLLQGVINRGPSVPVTAGETVSISLDAKHAVTATIGDGGSFQARLPTGGLAAGNYGIKYSYAGDSNFKGAADTTTTTLTVNKAQPTFSGLASSQTIINGIPNAIMSGVLNAGSSLPVPAGETVSITGSGNVVTATTTANGAFQANLPETDLGAASYDIGFSYLGDSNFLGTSAVLTITEPAAQTSTSLSPSVAPADLGRPVTITAIVTNVQGHYIPVGTVQFLVDGNPVGGAIPLVNGSASISVGPYRLPGTHAISASYQPATSTFLTSTGTLSLPVIRNLLVVITPPPATLLYMTSPYVFQVNYSNVGADASTAVLTETVPANTKFNAAASDPRWVAVGHGQYRLDLGTLNPGDAGVVAFAVTVSAKATVVVTDVAVIGFDVASRLAVSTSRVSTKVVFGRRFGH
jgi:hypothetical protein